MTIYCFVFDSEKEILHFLTRVFCSAHIFFTDVENKYELLKAPSSILEYRQIALRA